MQAPILAINKYSWHYRYFLWIRRFWGNRNVPERTSLCPYCQTILWFSVGATLASPFVGIGWVFAKLALWMENRSPDPQQNWYDTKFGRRVYYAAESDLPPNVTGFERESMLSRMSSVAIERLIIAMFGLILIAMVVAFLTIICAAMYFGLGFIWQHFTKFPHYAWVAIQVFGTGIFTAFWGIGWFLCEGVPHIGKGVWHDLSHGGVWLWRHAVTLFTNGPLWTMIGLNAAKIVGCCVSVALVTILVQHVNQSQWLVAWRERRAEARRIKRLAELEQQKWWRERQKELERARLAAMEKEPPKEETKPRDPWLIVVYWKKVTGWIDQKVDGCLSSLFGRSVYVKKQSYKVLGVFQIIGQFLWALKKGACPLIEFVDGAQLVKDERNEVEESTQKLIAAMERAKREKGETKERNKARIDMIRAMSDHLRKITEELPDAQPAAPKPETATVKVHDRTFELWPGDNLTIDEENTTQA